MLKLEMDMADGSKLEFEGDWDVEGALAVVTAWLDAASQRDVDDAAGQSIAQQLGVSEDAVAAIVKQHTQSP